MASYGETSGGAATHYQIHIRSPDRDIEIHAFMPENFTSSVSSEYDMPFAESTLRNVAGDKIETLARTFGFGSTTQASSMQVWQGAAPMDFSIPIQFLYTSDTETDIILPMKKLMELVLPSTGSGVGRAAVMESPGPKVSVNAGGGSSGSGGSGGGGGEGGGGGGLLEWVGIENEIQLAIGSFMLFDSVVITNVDSDYEIKLDQASRKPIALNATVAFRTFFTPTVQDLDRIFI